VYERKEPRRMFGSKKRDEQGYEDDYIMLIFVIFPFYIFLW
jgi:hypothetical protein